MQNYYMIGVITMFGQDDYVKLEALVEHLRADRNTSILVGAGISVSSGVPTSASIVHILKRLHLIERTSDYATAMQEAFDDAHERRSFLERLFIGKPPSQEHYSLAHLVEKRVFKTIFTTNFDHLTEIALSQTSNYSVYSYLTRQDLESISDRQNGVRVIKLHGDFLFSSLANTDEEIGHAITASMCSKFANLLENGSLIVLGYAGDGSILRMLGDLAARPEILKHGIWWILHSSAGKEPSPSPRVQELFRVMQMKGKRATILRNVFGAQWFLNELCRRITGEVPVKPRFGIGHTRSLSPQIGWDGAAPAHFNQDQVPYTLLDKLKRQIETTSVIFLKGPSDSAKTALATKLIAETRERPCFYFSFQFARNNPEDHSFLTEIGAFLDAKGFLTETLASRFWVEVLLERNGIIILDDLPISLDKTRRTVEPGAFRGSFAKVFYTLFAVLKKLSKGNLIVCLPANMPSACEGDFLNVSAIASELKVTEIVLPDDRQDKPLLHAIMRGLSRTQRQVLFAMTELRFAENAAFVAKVANAHGSVVDALHHLMQRGLVKGYGDKFVVRMPYRIMLLKHIYNTFPTEKIVKKLIHTASEYDRFSDDPECPSPRHCLLEAENLYYETSVGFRTDKWTAGMKALVQTSLSLAQSPLSADFIFHTLKSYFDAAGDRIFADLDLRDLATLFSAFALASPRNAELNPLLESFRSTLAKRNELIPAWLTAETVLKRNSYISPEGSAMLMSVKNQIRLNKRKGTLEPQEWELMGRCYLGLNRCFGILYAAIQKPELLKKAIRYGLLAQLCFEKCQNEIGKNDSARFLGVTYMNCGNYRGARRMLKPLFRKEMAQAGFGAFKAASLNNLYHTYLGVGAFRLAEGYFWEANYQYAHSNRAQFMGPLLAIAVLLCSKRATSKILEDHPQFREQLPMPQTILNKLIPIWDYLDGDDKRDEFFHVSQVFLIMSEWFDEHDQSRESLKALAFVVKMHEQCFDQPGEESAPAQLRQEIVLNQLKARIAACATSLEVPTERIIESLGPLRTKLMKDAIESLVQ